MKWISVKDKLPQDDKTVIIFLYNKKRKHFKGLIHIGWYLNNEWQNAVTQEKAGGAGFKLTHWMPLPKPPED